MSKKRFWNIVKKQTNRGLFWGFFVLSWYIIIAVKVFPQLYFVNISWFNRIEELNDILFNISIGYIVSSIFYYIVSYRPEQRKKKDALRLIDKYLNSVVNSMNLSIKYLHFKMKTTKNFNDLTRADFENITSFQSVPMNFTYQQKSLNGSWVGFSTGIESEIKRFIDESMGMPKVVDNILKLTVIAINLDEELIETLIKIKECNLYGMLRLAAVMNQNNMNFSMFHGIYDAFFEYYELFKKLQKYKHPYEIRY